MNQDEAFRKILDGTADSAADISALNARLDERRKLNAILTAWDVATADPKFKAPSYLMAVIEAARHG